MLHAATDNLVASSAPTGATGGPTEYGLWLTGISNTHAVKLPGLRTISAPEALISNHPSAREGDTIRGTPRSLMLTWANSVTGWWTSLALTTIRWRQR